LFRPYLSPRSLEVQEVLEEGWPWDTVAPEDRPGAHPGDALGQHGLKLRWRLADN